MALIRFQLDLAIPETVYNAIPQAKKDTFKNTIQAMKALAVRVGDEMTVRATWHKCHHDEGNVACDPEQDI